MKNAMILWFTGLSGSGKSTVADGLRSGLTGRGLSVLCLDGDEVRRDLHPKLGFSAADIRENNMRIARLCLDRRGDYDVIMVPIIAPFEDSRRKARDLLSPGFYEVYCDADVETVASRDVKGLYAKAKEGHIRDLVGFSPGSVYEPPRNPDFVVRSGKGGEPPEASIQRLLEFVMLRRA